MATHAPKPALDPAKTYTIDQFLDLRHDLNETETEWVLLHIASLRIQDNPKLKQHQITATGEEFLKTIEAVRRVLELMKTRPIRIVVPGQSPIPLEGPICPMITEMLKQPGTGDPNGMLPMNPCYHIPTGLTSLDQWVCWKYVRRNGTETKFPVCPVSKAFASTTDPSAWTSYSNAVLTATEPGSGLSGVGFVFMQGGGLVGIDIDECIRENGARTEEGQRAKDLFGASYHEISPSGTGLRFWIRGTLPTSRSGRRNSAFGVEVYQHSRFFTVTGNVPDDVRRPIVDCNEALQKWYVHKFPTDVDGAIGR